MKCKNKVLYNYSKECHFSLKKHESSHVVFTDVQTVF